MINGGKLLFLPQNCKWIVIMRFTFWLNQVKYLYPTFLRHYMAEIFKNDLNHYPINQSYFPRGITHILKKYRVMTTLQNIQLKPYYCRFYHDEYHKNIDIHWEELFTCNSKISKIGHSIHWRNQTNSLWGYPFLLPLYIRLEVKIPRRITINTSKTVNPRRRYNMFPQVRH